MDGLHQLAFRCLDKAYEAMIERAGDAPSTERFESWAWIVSQIMGGEAGH